MLIDFWVPNWSGHLQNEKITNEKNLERGPGKQKGKRKWIANNTRKIGEKEKTRQMKPPNDDVDTCSSLFSFNISFACTVHLFVYISVSALESQMYRYFFVFFFSRSHRDREPRIYARLQF